jgi:hypothetical protein
MDAEATDRVLGEQTLIIHVKRKKPPLLRPPLPPLRTAPLQVGNHYALAEPASACGVDHESMTCQYFKVGLFYIKDPMDIHTYICLFDGSPQGPN